MVFINKIFQKSGKIVYFRACFSLKKNNRCQTSFSLKNNRCKTIIKKLSSLTRRVRLEGGGVQSHHKPLPLYRRKNLPLLANRLAPHGFWETPEDQCTANSGLYQLIRAGLYIFKCFLSMEFWRGIFFKLGSKLFYHLLRRGKLSAPEMPLIMPPFGRGKTYHFSVTTPSLLLTR